MSENISQLVDRELDVERCDEQFDSLCAGDTTQNSWQNYHLIRNIIRGEIDIAGSDISVRISRALDIEPTVLAPRALKRERRVSPDIWKPVSMFAVAASLALVAVVTLNPATKKPDQVQLASSTTVADTIQQQKFAQEFGEMLVVHGEFTASAGLNGLLAYSKLVSNQRLEQ